MIIIYLQYSKKNLFNPKLKSDKGRWGARSYNLKGEEGSMHAHSSSSISLNILTKKYVKINENCCSVKKTR